MTSEPSTAQAAHHWYEVVQNDSLRQGDIVQNLPVFYLDDDERLPDSEDGDQVVAGGGYAWGNWVLVTPSCDLDTGRSSQVLLASCIEASDSNLKAQGSKDRAHKLQVISQGLDPSRLLLPEHAVDPEFPLSVAIIRNLGMLPLSVLKRSVADKRRLRLKHPFREKLGNWCAQWISNVGPENETLMPRFASIYAKHILSQDGA